MELYTAGLLSNKAALVFAAAELYQIYMGDRGLSFPPEMVERLDAIIDKTKDRSVAVTLLNLQVESGLISELEALSKIDDWKEIWRDMAYKKMAGKMAETRWNMNPNKAKAIMLAKRQLAEFVCDAVNLEGINYTLPEIQTLLDGITVGGHKVADQQIALKQADTWRTIFELVEKNQFAITVEQVCALHRIAAKDEALEWGKFRSGGVTIAGTNFMPPPAASLPVAVCQNDG